MLQAINSKDDLVNVRATDTGAIKVVLEEGSIQGVETTLDARVQIVGTEAVTIAVNKKITSIDIANYSETADLILTADDLSATIGNSVATSLAINKIVDNITLVSTQSNTKVQIIIKGVE